LVALVLVVAMAVEEQRLAAAEGHQTLERQSLAAAAEGHQTLERQSLAAAVEGHQTLERQSLAAACVAGSNLVDCQSVAAAAGNLQSPVAASGYANGDNVLCVYNMVCHVHRDDTRSSHRVLANVDMGNDLDCAHNHFSILRKRLHCKLIEVVKNYA
jgi:hypothetical protein